MFTMNEMNVVRIFLISLTSAKLATQVKNAKGIIDLQAGVRCFIFRGHSKIPLSITN